MTEGPEIWIARRLLEVKKLKPPIDVRVLVQHYATLIEVPFPIEVDGISIDLKRPGKRPKIIINENCLKQRRRFTLAHELGHVLIPWHVGTIVDEIDLAEVRSEQYWALEAEANRFAAELLMPLHWATELARRAPDPVELTNTISKEANVSIHAATLRAAACLAPGYVYAQFSARGIDFSGRSNGTHTSAPKVYTNPNLKALYPHARGHWHLRGSSYDVHWWQFPADLELPERPSETWREILDQIISDASIPSGHITKLKQQLNGIMAHANGRVRDKRTPEAVHAIAIQRLHENESRVRYLASLMKHRRFDEYCSSRIHEFFDK